MAEDWEDWENEDFTPQLPAVAAPQAAAAEEDLEASKFAGEDEEEDTPQYNVPKPQQVLHLSGVLRVCDLSPGSDVVADCAVQTWKEENV